MARTLPTIDGTPTETAVTYRLIDSSGDERAIRYVVNAAATSAQFEAVAATLAAVTNANLYEANIQNIYTGAKLASTAVAATYQSVYDNVVILMKLSALVSQQAYIPAPEGTLIPEGDIVDITDLDYQAYRDAVLTLLGGSYVAQSVRFTERREKNDSVPAT